MERTTGVMLSDMEREEIRVMALKDKTLWKKFASKKGTVNLTDSEIKATYSLLSSYFRTPIYMEPDGYEALIVKFEQLDLMVQA